MGKAVKLRDGNRIAVLSIGAIGQTVVEAIDSLQLPDQIAHYDMRWLKPLDETVLQEVCQQYQTIITVEDGVIDGGLGSAVAEHLPKRLIRLGVRDQFVEHGSTKELYQLLKLDRQGICESLLQALEQ